MNAVELIPIREHGGRPAVSGRELHEFLGVTTRYDTWFARMAEYGFTEGHDYVLKIERVKSESRGREYEQSDHMLTLDMGKQLGMIQRNDRGRMIREYFIAIENRAREVSATKSLEQRTLELVGELHSKVQEQQAELVEIRPLASQARTFNRRKGNTGKQAFARDVIGMALDLGVKVTANQVYEFMGVKLDMFIHGVGLRSHGHASLNGKRRGLSDTDKGENKVTGHPYEQGMLTPKGVEYAWARIEAYVREHGHLELPKKEIAA